MGGRAVLLLFLFFCFFVYQCNSFACVSAQVGWDCNKDLQSRWLDSQHSSDKPQLL